MSAALVLLFLIGMAAIVWSACFVGCSFHQGGPGITAYENTVTETSGLLALWPLNDTSGTTAADYGHYSLTGTYTGPAGTFALGQTGIVVGDTCVYFNGGYVNISGEASFGAPNFTIEAWVKPNWASSDKTTKAVVASASGAPSPDRGFALYATPNSTNSGLLWAAGLGLGGTKEAVAVSADNQTIMQDSLYFLVVTYDGTTLTLWVNPADTAAGAQATGGGTNPLASGYVPVPPQIPLFIGMGRPDLTPPLYPFNGWIQEVAFYNVVLPDKTIENHYGAGLGMTLS